MLDLRLVCPPGPDDRLLDELTDIAPDISDDEGKAIRTAVDRLNARAIKMLTVG